MRIAIPVWNGRVSPVFDVAKTIRVVDVDEARGLIQADSLHAVVAGKPAATLSALGVEVLICSAISPQTEATVWVSGVEVIPDICGSPDEIVAAVVAGDSDLVLFRSPGSHRRRHAKAAAPPRLEGSK